VNEKLEHIESTRDSRNTREHFKSIKEVRGAFQPKQNIVKDRNGNNIVEQQKVQDSWRDHFEELLNRPDPVEPVVGNGEEREDDVMNDPTVEEIVALINKLKNNKAPGEDEVTGEWLKCAGREMQERLAGLLLSMWQAERIPDRWKEGIVIPLHKKGDRNTYGNYRGISLLDMGYKVFTKMIYARLQQWCGYIVGK
jgi:hypothetical protein